MVQRLVRRVQHYMTAPRIWLIEGAHIGADSLQEALQREGYDIQLAHSVHDASARFPSDPPDLIVFHAASMKISGVQECGLLRETVQDVPIIHTREEGQRKDERAMADVYLVKPFTSRKVLNRIRALLPADQFTQEIVRAGDLTLFCSKPSVDVPPGGEKRLTPKVAHLLAEFFRYPNKVLDRRQLMRNVWDTDYVGDTRTLDVHIRWLREAIEEDPSQPCRIVTVRGVGYFFKLPSGT